MPLCDIEITLVPSSRAVTIVVYLIYGQVHGIVHDTLEFVRRILSVEINSATDNPVSLLLVVFDQHANPRCSSYSEVDLFVCFFHGRSTFITPMCVDRIFLSGGPKCSMHFWR